MSPSEEKTYFLYGIGRTPEVLSLGSLVLNDYAKPTRPLWHYRYPLLSKDEERQLCSVSDLSTCIFHRSSGRKLGLSIDAAEIITLDLSWARSSELIIAASSGRRVEIREPATFLNERTLHPNNEAARSLMQVWLTAPLLDRIVDGHGVIHPKIWMLTGFYELTGTRCYEMRKDEQGASAGARSRAVAELTGVRLGGSLDLGSGFSMIEQGVGLDTPHIWAAQYRRLDVKYLDAKAKQLETKLSKQFRLLPDSTSRGPLRGEAPKRAEVKLQEDAEDPDYDDDLNRAIEELYTVSKLPERKAGERKLDEPTEDEK